MHICKSDLFRTNLSSRFKGRKVSFVQNNFRNIRNVEIQWVYEYVSCFEAIFKIETNSKVDYLGKIVLRRFCIYSESFMNYLKYNSIVKSFSRLV